MTPFAVVVLDSTVKDNEKAHHDVKGVVVDFIIHHSVIQAIVVTQDGKVLSKKLNEITQAEMPEVRRES